MPRAESRTANRHAGSAASDALPCRPRRSPIARTLYDSPFVAFDLVDLDTPAGTREYVRLRVPDWANVAALTAAGEVVLVRQHRIGIDAETLELPGGIVDPGEDPAEGVLRELREETGYGGGELVPLGFVHPNPAMQDNRIFLFALLGAERLGEPEPDEDEAIEVELASLAELPALLRTGAITHALVVNTCQQLLLLRDEPRFAPYFASAAVAAR